MAKTYIPSAVDVVMHANKYLTRYQAKMTIGATPGQITALGNLLACCVTFLQEWKKAAPIN